jgi:ABC-2 type transport system permease protein
VGGRLPLTLESIGGFVLLSPARGSSSFFQQYATGLLTFWTDQTVGLERVWFSVSMVLSGALAPLDLFPEGVRAVLPYTPFPYLVDVPVQALLGRWAGRPAAGVRGPGRVGPAFVRGLARLGCGATGLKALRGGGRVRRYLRLWRIFFTHSLIQDLEYRVNWWMNAFNTLLFLGSSALVLWVVFTQADAIGGWTFDQALTLLGVYLLIEGVTVVFLVPNLNRVPQYVRKGELDYLLLKPIAARFIVSTRYASVWWVPQLGLALGGDRRRDGAPGHAHARALGSCWRMLVAAIGILYAVWFALTTTAFWFVKVDNVSELFTAFFAAGASRSAPTPAGCARC